ncbi:MAG: NADPH-dependent F420 reductase [Chloroflexota bacterium]
MSLEKPEKPTLAFIGGTGPEGKGLALQFARLGYPVVIGSRSLSRATDVADEIRHASKCCEITGTDNVGAATQATIVFLTIPYIGVSETLASLTPCLEGKVVVSAIAPIEFQGGRPIALQPEAGSAAQEVQKLLPESRVVSAFQTVDAHSLWRTESLPDTDVLVSSDDVDARRTLVRMASELPGIRGLSCGRLGASRYVEECTALLITINRIYKVHSGIRITGIDRD